mmetsp:Transcript_42329/g.68644  ORF Transcript_42329/g.68644 Transcript_42329/m.68644 type:complete len:342 (-) Transcript_42329:270-1295(-)
MYEGLLHRLCAYWGDRKQLRDRGMLKRCDTTEKFITCLRSLCSSDETTYLVIDKAERLREMDSNVLPALLRLDQLEGSNIRIILISEIIWGNFHSGVSTVQPIQVEFKSYSKEELVEILSRESQEDVDFYRVFVRIVLDQFLSSCRNIKELRCILNMLFLKYKEPVLSGKVGKQDTNQLYASFKPYLKQSFDKIYHHDEELEVVGGACTLESELPPNTRYILVAAYLASHNLPKHDHFFSRTISRKKRPRQIEPKTQEVDSHMQGPAAFPLERMFAIFQGITEKPLPVTITLYHEVATLVELDLLTKMSEGLDSIKLKCNISHMQAKKLASSLDINLAKFQ